MYVYFCLMTKKELRAKYKAMRKALSNEDIDSMSLEISNMLLGLDIWEHDNYHVFLPIEEQREVNTEYLLSILLGKDKNTIISRSDFSNLAMTHVVLTDSTLIKKNSYGIPEPQGGIEFPANQVDVVFVPLLAYDEFGHRVGYGKGFYDRFLGECKPNVIKVGLSFFDPEPRIDDIHPNDISLDHCVSPKGSISI